MSREHSRKSLGSHGRGRRWSPPLPSAIGVVLLAAGVAPSCDWAVDPPPGAATPTATASTALSLPALGASTSATPAIVTAEPALPVVDTQVVAPDLDSSLASRPSVAVLPDDGLVLEPGPATTLWLAPARLTLDADPDLTARLAALAFKRRDARRLEVFSDDAAIAAVWGTVVAADAVVLDAKDDPAGAVATRYQVKPLRAWKTDLRVELRADLIDVWALGTDGAAAHLPGDPPPREQTLSGEVYLAVGQEVLLNLTRAPLFPGDAPRLRVLGGSSGALGATATADAKVDLSSLTAFARTLDQTFTPVTAP